MAHICMLKDVPIGARIRMLNSSPWWREGWFGTRIVDAYVRFEQPSMDYSRPKGLASVSGSDWAPHCVCDDGECVWAVSLDEQVEFVSCDFSTVDEGGIV